METPILNSSFNPLDRGNSNQNATQPAPRPVAAQRFNPLDRGNSNQMKEAKNEVV